MHCLEHDTCTVLYSDFLFCDSFFFFFFFEFEFVDTTERERTDLVELLKKLRIDAEVQVSGLLNLVIVGNVCFLDPMEVSH